MAVQEDAKNTLLLDQLLKKLNMWCRVLEDKLKCQPMNFCLVGDIILHVQWGLKNDHQLNIPITQKSCGTKLKAEGHCKLLTTTPQCSESNRE